MSRDSFVAFARLDRMEALLPAMLAASGIPLDPATVEYLPPVIRAKSTRRLLDILSPVSLLIRLADDGHGTTGVYLEASAQLELWKLASGARRIARTARITTTLPGVRPQRREP